MRPLQRWSVYNLSVVVSGVTLYLILFFLFDRNIASRIAGPLTCGSFGVGALLLRRKREEDYSDEREREIERSASLIGLWMFYVYFVAAGIYIMFSNGGKTISTDTFSTFWWLGVFLLVVTMSLSTIVQYGWGKEKRTAVLEYLYGAGELQKGAIMTLVIMSAILTVFLFIFPLHPSSPVDWAMGIFYMLTAVFMFFSLSANISVSERDAQDTSIIAKARRERWWVLIATFLAGLALIAAVYAFQGVGAVDMGWFLLAGYCAFGVAGLSFLASIIIRSRG
ncbi:hypothetical protein LLH00_00030 [bacterium]|nr:hypothetical protein [bacterium]